MAESTPNPPASIQGASYAEQLLDSARRNNTELLLTIKAELNNDHEALSKLINTTKELITHNSPLHLACSFGNWEFIDIILDIEGVEIDPQNRDGQSPLHLAVKYTKEEPEHGYFVVDNLLDAGSDPRIQDKSHLKPVSYTDDPKLKQLLQSAEYAISMEIPEAEQLGEDGAPAEEDDGEGSASDSD